MSKSVEEIEKAVSSLSETDLRKFREWYLNFDAEQWDAQFVRDVAAGRLDALGEQAIAEHEAGESTPL